MRTTLLRDRLLATLAAMGAVSVLGVEGCGGGTVTTGLPDGVTATGDGAAASDATPVDGSDAGEGAATLTCTFGRKSTECFTHEGLVQMLANPPRGGDVGNDGGRVGHFDADGCLPASEVQNGCCNPASLGPSLESGKCCYVFCTGGCCGRPFLADGVARTAPVIARDGWSGRAKGIGDAPDLTEAQRAILGDAWARDAAMEHASIAAFARFSLDLMAHGAPGDLVRSSHEAALDEIAHAEAAFALASRFRGRVLGPGPLPCGGITASDSLARAVVLTIHEGCVGEVVAALVAGRALERTVDPEARLALEKVTEDEARHADLAYRFVAWAIREGGPEIAAEARRAFDAALAAGAGDPDRAEDEDEELLGRYGQLSSRERALVARDARRTVVAPLRDALLSGAGCYRGPHVEWNTRAGDRRPGPRDAGLRPEEA